MNGLYALPEAPSPCDWGLVSQESLLMLQSWAWIHPPCWSYLRHIQFIISFHFQFGFGNQDRHFQFLQGVLGPCLYSSLVYTLQPRFPPHVSLVSAQPTQMSAPAFSKSLSTFYVIVSNCYLRVDVGLRNLINIQVLCLLFYKCSPTSIIKGNPTEAFCGITRSFSVLWVL